jgi:hypothetical protein
VVAVFAFALPKIAGLSDVWDDVRSMSTPTTVLLVIVAIWNLISYAFVLAAATPGLGFRRPWSSRSRRPRSPTCSPREARSGWG